MVRTPEGRHLSQPGVSDLNMRRERRVVCDVCGGYVDITWPESHFTSYDHKRAIVVARLAKAARR